MGPLNYRLNDNGVFVKVVKKGTTTFFRQHTAAVFL